MRVFPVPIYKRRGVRDAVRDFLHALRAFKRAPLVGFTIVSTVALGLGQRMGPMFARDPAVLGRRLLVNGITFEIVGSAPIDGELTPGKRAFQN
jgi:hypothetical protein